MNYATERLLAASKAAMAVLAEHTQYDEGEQSAETEAANELEGALHYFDAHGDKPAAASEDILADMEAVFECVKVGGHGRCEWLFIEEKFDELIEALGYDEGGRVVEVLGFLIRICFVLTPEGWALARPAS